MFFTTAADIATDSALSAFCSQSNNLVKKLTLDSQETLYERETNFSALVREGRNLYLLTSGQVSLILGEKVLLEYEAGDLLGLESLASNTCRVVAHGFAVKATPISLRLIEDQLGKQDLSSLTLSFTNLLLQAYAGQLPDSTEFEPAIRRYEAGETIVEQGSKGGEIFTLLEGRANAIVDGKTVGEIHSDEVFGALAALTQMERTATIRAQKDCLVLSLPRDRLLELIKLRPGTIEKLIADLARVIKDLNQKLTSVA